MLYNLVDRIYIGHIEGTGAIQLTALGICTPLILGVSAFAYLVGSGGGPKASIASGEKNDAKAEKILANSAVLLTILGVILTILLLCFNKPMLLAFGGSENTIGYALDYMWLRECGRSVGAAAPAKPAKQEAPSDYSAMSKDELIRELMKKGIEAARLKKAMRRKGAARKRCSFLQAAGIPSDRGAAGEVARPGPLPRDAGQPERVPRMPFPAGRCWGPAPCMTLLPPPLLALSRGLQKSSPSSE